jgi:hypothetical protein
MVTAEARSGQEVCHVEILLQAEREIPAGNLIASGITRKIDLS